MAPPPPRPDRKFSLFVFGLVFVGIFGAAAIHAFRQPRLYQSSGTLEVAAEIDLAERTALARSAEIVERVAKWLADEDLTAFLSPYGYANDVGMLEIERVLTANRSVAPVSKTRVIVVSYRHPDRDVAAKVALRFMEESIFADVRREIDEEIHEVEALALRYEQQKQKVLEAHEALVAYRESQAGNTDDAVLRALEERIKTEQQSLDSLAAQLRERSMLTRRVSSLMLIHKEPVPPSEDDYLLGPIVQTLAWGSTAATIGGLLALAVVNAITSRSRRRGVA